MSLQSNHLTIQYFKFEEDFIEDNIRCIPMIVRYKLDACGIKLKLKEWSKMNESERILLAEKPCSQNNEIAEYKEFLKQTILKRTGENATEILVEENPAWMITTEIPEIVRTKCTELGYALRIEQWQQLKVLERFVLIKLSRPSHENANFPKAMLEFKLINKM